MVFEHKLIDSADKSLLVRRDRGHESWTRPLRLEETIQKLPTVADIEPPTDMLNDFLEPNQREKLGLDPGHQTGSGAAEIQRAGLETGEC